MYTLKKDTAIDVPFYLHDTSGVAVIGATISTKRISKGSAGAFAAMTVAITEMENGWYKAALTDSHTDTLGLLTLMISDGTNPQVNLQWKVEPTNIPVNVAQISGSSTAADNLKQSALGITPGAATAVTLSTTTMSTDLTEDTDNHYIGRIIIWITGSLAGQATDITGYDGTTKILTFTVVTESPTDGDTFVII